MYSEMDVTLTLTCGVLHLSCYPANPLHSQLIVALLLLAANCQVNVREKQGCRICVSTAARYFFHQALLHDLRDFYTILRDFCAILHDFYTILHPCAMFISPEP